MSLALRYGEVGDEDSFFVYFDAVTAYSRSFSGSVTKHPIDAGASVVDHFVKENPVITLSAVITGVDVSTGSFNIRDLEGNNTPYNVRQAPDPVVVSSTDNSMLAKLIPASVGQFLPDNEPDVTLADARSSVLSQIRSQLEDLIVGVRISPVTGRFENNINVVKLYEYDGTTLTKVINNLVVTAINFTESPDSGEGLYCDITLEQVTFARLRTGPVDASVYEASSQAAAAEVVDKGKQDSTEQPADATNRSRLLEFGGAAGSAISSFGGN